jgi:hypothetical protein
VLPGRKWFLAIDTAKPFPGDMATPGKELYLPNQMFYPLEQRSIVVLLSHWC